jgi:hypothetical protein
MFVTYEDAQLHQWIIINRRVSNSATPRRTHATTAGAEKSLKVASLVATVPVDRLRKPLSMLWGIGLQHAHYSSPNWG